MENQKISGQMVLLVMMSIVLKCCLSQGVTNQTFTGTTTIISDTAPHNITTKTLSVVTSESGSPIPTFTGISNNTSELLSESTIVSSVTSLPSPTTDFSNEILNMTVQPLSANTKTTNMVSNTSDLPNGMGNVNVTIQGYSTTETTEPITSSFNITATTELSENFTENDMVDTLAQTESNFMTLASYGSTETSTEVGTTEPVTNSSQRTTGTQIAETTTMNDPTKTSQTDFSTIISSSSMGASTVISTTGQIISSFPITMGTKFSGNTTGSGQTEVSMPNESNFTFSASITAGNITEPMINSSPLTTAAQGSENSTATRGQTDSPTQIDSNSTATEFFTSTNTNTEVTTEPVTKDFLLTTVPQFIQNTTSNDPMELITITSPIITTEIQFTATNSSTFNVSSPITQLTDMATTEEMLTIVQENLNSTTSGLMTSASNQTESDSLTSPKSVVNFTVPDFNETSSSLTMTAPTVTVTESAENTSALISTFTDILPTVTDSIMTNNTNMLETTNAEDTTTEISTPFFETTLIGESTTDKTTTAVTLFTSSATFETPTTSNFTFSTMAPAPTNATPIVTASASNMTSETTTKGDITSTDTMAVLTTTSTVGNLARLRFTLQTFQNVTSTEFQSRLAKGIAMSYSAIDEKTRRKRAVSETDGDYTVTVFSTKLVSENDSAVEADYSVQKNGSALSAAEAISKLENSSQIIVNNLKETNISIVNLTLSVATSVQGSTTILTKGSTAAPSTTASVSSDNTATENFYTAMQPTVNSTFVTSTMSSVDSATSTTTALSTDVTAQITNTTVEATTVSITSNSTENGIITQTPNVTVTMTIPTTNVTSNMTNPIPNITMATQVTSDSTSLTTNVAVATTVTPMVNVTSRTTSLTPNLTVTSTITPFNNVTSGPTTLDFNDMVTSATVSATKVTSGMTTFNSNVLATSTTVHAANVTSGMTLGTNVISITSTPPMTFETSTIPTTVGNTTAPISITSVVTSIVSATMPSVPTTSFSTDTIVRMRLTLDTFQNVTSTEFQSRLAKGIAMSYSATDSKLRRRRAVSETDGDYNVTVFSTKFVSENDSLVEADYSVERNGSALSAAEAIGRLNNSSEIIVDNLRETNISIANLTSLTVAASVQDSTTVVTEGLTASLSITSGAATSLPKPNVTSTMSPNMSIPATVTFLDSTMSTATEIITTALSNDVTDKAANTTSIGTTIAPNVTSDIIQTSNIAVTSTAIPTTNVTSGMTNPTPNITMAARVTSDSTSLTTNVAASTAISMMNVTSGAVSLTSNVAVTSTAIPAVNVTSGTNVTIISIATTPPMTSETSTIPAMAGNTTASNDLVTSTQPTTSFANNTIVRMTFTLNNSTVKVTSVKFQEQLASALAESFSDLTSNSSRRRRAVSEEVDGFIVTVLSSKTSIQNSSRVDVDFTVERNGTVLSAEVAVVTLNKSLSTVIQKLKESNISAADLDIRALQDVISNPSSTTEANTFITSEVSTTASSTLATTTEMPLKLVQIVFISPDFNINLRQYLAQALADSYSSSAKRRKRDLDKFGFAGGYNVSVKAIDFSINNSTEFVNGYYTVVLNDTEISAEQAVMMLPSLDIIIASLQNNNINASNVNVKKAENELILCNHSVSRSNFYGVVADPMRPNTGFVNVSYFVFTPIQSPFSVDMPEFYVCALEPCILGAYNDVLLINSNTVQTLQIRQDPFLNAEFFYAVYVNGIMVTLPDDKLKSLTISVAMNSINHTVLEVYIPSDIEYRAELIVSVSINSTLNESTVQKALDAIYTHHNVKIRLFASDSNGNHSADFIEYTVTAENGTLWMGNQAAKEFNETAFRSFFPNSSFMNVTATKAPYYSILRTPDTDTSTISMTTNPDITAAPMETTTSSTTSIAVASTLATSVLATATSSPSVDNTTSADIVTSTLSSFTMSEVPVSNTEVTTIVDNTVLTTNSSATVQPTSLSNASIASVNNTTSAGIVTSTSSNFTISSVPVSNTEVTTVVDSTTILTMSSSSLSNISDASESVTVTANLSVGTTTMGFNNATSNSTEMTTDTLVVPPVIPWYIIVIIILGSLVVILILIIIFMCLKYYCGGKSTVFEHDTITKVNKKEFPTPHSPIIIERSKQTAEPLRKEPVNNVSVVIQPEPQLTKQVSRRPIPQPVSPDIVPPSAKMSKSAPPIAITDIQRARFSSSIHPVVLPSIHQNLLPELLSDELTDDAMAKRNMRQRSEIERHKNKQRIRRQKSPYSDSYRNMQQEIDSVLDPSAAILRPPRFHKRRGKMNLVGREPRNPDIKLMPMNSHPQYGQYSRIDPHRRKDSLTDDGSSVSEDSGVTSPETTRRKMANLLQDAFSLISPSGQKNLVGPIPPKMVQPISDKQPPMHHPDGRTSSPHHRSFPHSSAQPTTSGLNSNPLLFTRSQPPPFFTQSTASSAVNAGPTASGNEVYITPSRPISSAADNTNSQIWTPYRAFDGTASLQQATPQNVNSNFNNSNAMLSSKELLNSSMPSGRPPPIPGFVPSMQLPEGSYYLPITESPGVNIPPPSQFQGYQMLTPDMQPSTLKSKPAGSGSDNTSASSLVQSIKEELAKLTGSSTPVEDFK